jgi:hypothetical protein
MTRYVVVRLQFQGIHSWPDAPDGVSFLRSPHRHVFHVEGRKVVDHSNRDVEFITLKNDVERWLASRFQWPHGIADMGHLSCEMVAEELVNEFGLAECIVFEDGENGGGVAQ